MGAVGRFREESDPVVFLFGAGLSVGLILFCFVGPTTAENGIAALDESMLTYLDRALLTPARRLSRTR